MRTFDKTVFTFKANEYGICGGQSGTGTGFSPSTFVFPRQYRSTTAPYSINSSVHSFIHSFIHSFTHQRRYAVKQLTPLNKTLSLQ